VNGFPCFLVYSNSNFQQKLLGANESGLRTICQNLSSNQISLLNLNSSNYEGDYCVDDSNAIVFEEEYQKTNMYKTDMLYNPKKHLLKSTDFKVSDIVDYTKNSYEINSCLIEDNLSKLEKLKPKILSINNYCIYSRMNYSEMKKRSLKLNGKNPDFHDIKLNSFYVSIMSTREGSLVVFRGSSLDSKDYKMIKNSLKNSVSIRFKSFISMSLDYKVAKSFVNAGYNAGENKIKILYMVVIEDDNIDCAYLENLTQYKGENEVLMRPYRRFRVVYISNYSSSMMVVALSFHA